MKPSRSCEGLLDFSTIISNLFKNSSNKSYVISELSLLLVENLYLVALLRHLRSINVVRLMSCGGETFIFILFKTDTFGDLAGEVSIPAMVRVKILSTYINLLQFHTQIRG